MFLKTLFNIDKISNRRTPPIKLPNGKYFIESPTRRFDFKFKNMTANKNKITIATAYIIINKNAKRSHSNKNNIKDDGKNLNTKNRIEYIEFVAEITNLSYESN